ncbi:MAG: neutral zinc metallopeptidase [Hyphomonadaceae bacterium]|nr:neutral zinc metallopeptidase [Hyphomonadaceae bacterium]
MRIDNQRRSDNFRDRGAGRGGGGGGVPAAALFAILGRLGFRGVLIVGVIALAAYFFVPGLRGPMMGALGIGGGGEVASSGEVCAQHEQACDFSRAILGSTEDVWRAQFAQGRLPNYGQTPSTYTDPTLNVFQGQVSTACGVAPSSVGPFYCPGDNMLYIDPTFYETMATRLRAPGDFAQAYVIAHEVGHHVQNLIGSMRRGAPGETENQTSVRTELQADCFAGVWGHTARADLAIDDADLREALGAAHAIGDDTLQRQSQGYVNPNEFSHGTSAQRMAWFRRGFDSGDARQCDTFAVRDYNAL